MDAPDGCPSPSDIAANSLLRETLRTFATWCLTVTGSPWLGPRCASGHDSIRTKPPLPHQPAPCTASSFRVMRDRHRIFGRRGGRMKRRKIFLFMFLPPPPQARAWQNLLSMSIMARLISDTVRDAAYGWLCQRRRDYPDCSGISLLQAALVHEIPALVATTAAPSAAQGRGTFTVGEGEWLRQQHSGGKGKMPLETAVRLRCTSAAIAFACKRVKNRK